MRKRKIKHSRTILEGILIPAAVMMICLPLVFFLVFRYTAKEYAYQEAGKELENLKKNVMPLVKNRLYGNSNEEIDIRVQEFLKAVSPLVRKMGGSARMLILEPGLNVVYPKHEEEREEVRELAQECKAFISAGSWEGTEELLTKAGDTFLVNVYELPKESPRIRYLVFFCQTSGISRWVNGAGRLVMAISLGLSLFVVVGIWIAVKNVTKQLDHLCKGAEMIGKGEFCRIGSAFELTELEWLRVSMNRMAIELEKADRVQREFFQNVSHELRNPLMSISGYAQGIEQGFLKEPGSAAHIILEESRRLTELVNRLLTLSRMENGEKTASPELLYVDEAVEDCLDRVNGLAMDKGVTLRLFSFDHEMRVWADEELLATIMDNLLTNAIRYARKNVGVEVQKGGGAVRIRVADDGEGISPEDFPHIFERCYKGKGGIFGIGLAIARTAARSMSGELMAENRAVGGAVFTCVLPAEEGRAAMEPEREDGILKGGEKE